MMILIKKIGKLMVPASIIMLVIPILLKKKAQKLGLRIKTKSNTIDIIKGFDVIRISSDHAVYLEDIIGSFGFYFNAVVPFKESNSLVVDYSTTNAN